MPKTTKQDRTTKGHLAKFTKAFNGSISAEDKVEWDDGVLEAVSNSVYEIAKQRKFKEVKLNVFIPEKKKHGWSMEHTVIGFVCDDTPFILDSVSAEIAAQGLNIEAVFHPVLHIKRNASSGLVDNLKIDLKNKEEGYQQEAFAFIVLEQLLSEEAISKLEIDLINILKEVRVVTSDYKPMLSKMADVIKELSTAKINVADCQLQESLEFLKYLSKGNLTFLGYKYFKFTEIDGDVESNFVEDSEIGILKDENRKLPFGQGLDSNEIVALDNIKPPLMISKIAGAYSSVHRRVPMDAISIKSFNDNGEITGMHLFVGLFTFNVYSCSVDEIPFVRTKVFDIMTRSGFSSYSQDRTAMEHILEKIPRDELFQISTADLYKTAMGILKLKSKNRVSLFMNRDNMKQYMSCLLYVPRDRYNTKYREVAGKVLERYLGGDIINYYTSMDDSDLARVLFTITTGRSFNLDQQEIEHELSEIGREWDDLLRRKMIDVHGKKEGKELAHVYGNAFSRSYHDSQDIKGAVHDIEQIETLLTSENKMLVDIYQKSGSPSGYIRVKIYHKHKPVYLSDILPVVENMGLKCISEVSYKADPQGVDTNIWIHDFSLIGDKSIDIEKAKKNFEEAFLKIWSGEAESDAINKLILLSNLSWHDIRILRAYNSFCNQAKFNFSKQYVEEVLSLYPKISEQLICFFKERNDPNLKNKGIRGQEVQEKIIDMLQAVDRLDHDRILRSLLNLIENTLRTNFFQKDENGNSLPYLTLKLDSKNIPDLPLPKPYVEIFVYSSRIEGIHLRGGKIARGGLRWSDRWDDFRTETLGLMKAQMVKNTVIVPVGSKGGFIVKQPPATGGKDAYQQEGIECYRVFIRSLLEITDNNVKGKIVRPKNVVCHDEIDTYLVVAADKGTATFSDIANETAMGLGFWLGDAFASGGSSGYDHKEMGITAKGGWESIKRHFREMDKDIQCEEFSVIGVGDMGGDVFGNGMLLSKHIKLIGVFNHLHIFCDPNPDVVISYEERERLFQTKGGWDSYNSDLISPGGAVYNRSDKRLKLTSEIKKAFNISKNHVTPDELISAILKSEAELLWFGGIGTYIKSEKESNADVDDKANDIVRVDALDVRASVIGEGANLAITQEGRIEFARGGGYINTDFIDNSAGVDCSDHEVNIKILLSEVKENGKLSLKQRNRLLEKMTDKVSDIVLRDNYQQTGALSSLVYKTEEHVGLHAEFIRDLSKAGLISRKLEHLPNDETLAHLTKEGLGLTSPEFAVLLSYAKMTLYDEVIASKVVDDPAFEELLFYYFPDDLHKYEEEIKSHKLKREIIATQIVNIIINRMGPLFVSSRISKTGASIDNIIKAFMIVTNSFSVRDIWRVVEGLDNQVHTDVQMLALHETAQVIKRAVTWFLRFGGESLDMNEEFVIYNLGIKELRDNIDLIITSNLRNSLKEKKNGYINQGMPKDLANEIAKGIFMSSTNDIISIARKMDRDVKEVGSVYFKTGDRLSLDWLRQQAMSIVPKNDWQARVLSGIIDDFYIQQANLTTKVLDSSCCANTMIGGEDGEECKCISDWFTVNSGMVSKIVKVIDNLKGENTVDIDMLTLVSQRMAQLLYKT